MNLKEFYEIAKEELEQLYGHEPLDFRLEAVDREVGTKHWDVVVSYLVENKYSQQLAILPPSKYERIYKSLEINDEKEVVGFHIFSGA